MGLIKTFDLFGIHKRLEKVNKQFREKVIQSLDEIGAECVDTALENADYDDPMGNLRSSIGYVVLDNGEEVNSGGFKQIEGSLGIKYGSQKGKDLAEELAGNHSEGFVLIVVAGMENAAAEEAKGKDVLTSSEELAKKEILKVLNKVQQEMKGEP